MITQPGMRDWIFADNLPPLVWDLEQGMSTLAKYVVEQARYIRTVYGAFDDSANSNAVRFFAGAIIAGSY